MSTDANEDRETEPTDGEVVDIAAAAAEGFVLSQYKQSRITDIDVAVGFADGTLDVDVYLNVPTEPDDPDPDQVVEKAVEAAIEAVDELFAASDSETEESSTIEPPAEEEGYGDADDR